MVMTGRLHVDTPSIGDVVPEPALVVFDMHDDSYIAIEFIAF